MAPGLWVHSRLTQIYPKVVAKDTDYGPPKVLPYTEIRAEAPITL